jgi:hypothetical protein
LEHLLFPAYLVLFAWLVTKVKFFKESGLNNAQLIILFLLKVMAGIFYGWIGVYYGEMAQMIDTWAYHVESLQEYALLKSHPIDFVTSLFHSSYDNGYGNFLTTHNSFWNDVKANFLIKIMAVFHLFSFGHYYVNVIFYSFITLFGPIAIFRVMTDIYPGRKMIILMATFLLPSFLYWTSGLHKEGLIFSGLSMMLYHLYFGFKENRFSLRRILSIFLGFIIVLILRNFLILTVLPPLFAWFLSRKMPFKALTTFTAVMSLAIIFFFTARYIHPSLDFPAATVVKQHEFLKLRGGSAVPVKELTPSGWSFLANLPQSISLTLIRPYPSDVRHLLSLAAALEINFLLLLFIIYLIWHKPIIRQNAFIICCLFISFGILLMVGYTVNILGAIVRYRSIVLPFLVVPMVAQTDWPRISRVILSNIKIKNNI